MSFRTHGYGGSKKYAIYNDVSIARRPTRMGNDGDKSGSAMIKSADRLLLAVIAVSKRSCRIALVAVVVAVGASPGARADAGAVTCTNPTSGTTWKIRIDYQKATVDANPARITDAKISWHDATDGGNYTLDRKSGNLTVVVASSTGGFFLYHRCALEN